MINKLFLFSFVLTLLYSCKAKVPEDVIERDKMQDLLYDYHLAQSIAKGKNDSVDYHIRLYTDAVFRKYGVNEDKFNHSMEWYTRNSEELFTIYKQLDKRYAEARTAGIVQGNRYASMTEVGDTMNIWKGKDFYLLTNAWNTHIDFQQAADSTFHKGDKFMWQFETNWYYREGQKNAIAVLALIYENDSVASTTQTLYSTGKQEIFITASSKPVKSVEGFVYLTSPWSELPRILTINEPVLVKFSKSDKAPLKMRDVLAADSAARASSGKVLKMEKSVQNDPPQEGRILSLPR